MQRPTSKGLVSIKAGDPLVVRTYAYNKKAALAVRAYKLFRRDVGNIAAEVRIVVKHVPRDCVFVALKRALFVDAGLLGCDAVPFPRRSARSGNGCIDGIDGSE
jgi:hypothetical protein